MSENDFILRVVITISIASVLAIGGFVKCTTDINGQNNKALIECQTQGGDPNACKAAIR